MLIFIKCQNTFSQILLHKLKPGYLVKILVLAEDWWYKEYANEQLALI